MKTRGISLGCPLSPLIGTFFLDELDRRMSETGLFYVRFMDDILVLAPTRWKLRRPRGRHNRCASAWYRRSANPPPHPTLRAAREVGHHGNV